MIIETNTKPLWCPNCDAKDKRIAELENSIEILQSRSKGEVIFNGFLDIVSSPNTWDAHKIIKQLVKYNGQGIIISIHKEQQ